MSIKTWQERCSVYKIGLYKDDAMQAEIDELRAALAERDAEIERLKKLKSMKFAKEVLHSNNTLRTAAQQALEALRSGKHELRWAAEDALTAALESK